MSKAPETMLELQKEYHVFKAHQKHYNLAEREIIRRDILNRMREANQ